MIRRPRAAWPVACGLTLWLAACSTPSDRVILLPGAGDRPTGAVSVRAARGELLLAEPYALADVTDGAVTAGRSSAHQVQADYAALLAQRPAPPRTWVLYFEPGGNQLIVQSLQDLEELRAAVAAYAAGDVVVVGHTDRVGSVADNDRLSLARALAVRDLLVGAGVPAARITTSGRGERAPLVPTADEVAEARNRRVEIRLR